MKLPLGLTPNHVKTGARQLRASLRKATMIGITVWIAATGVMVLHALGIVPYDVLDLNRIDLENYHRRAMATVRTDEAIGSGFLVNDRMLVTSFAAVGDVAIDDEVSVSFAWPDAQAAELITAKVLWLPEEDSESEVVVVGFDEPIEDADVLELSEYQPADGARVVVIGFDPSTEQLLEIMAQVLPGGAPFQLEPTQTGSTTVLDWPGYAILSAEDLGVMAVTIGGTSAVRFEDEIEEAEVAAFGATTVN